LHFKASSWRGFAAMVERRHQTGEDGDAPWPIAFRLNSFRRTAPDAVTALRSAAAVPGVSAVELNYPQHFREFTEEAVAALLTELGLPLTALNLRFDDARWRRGAFTAPEQESRDAAVAVAGEAVATAARLGASHVVLWMENDGWDYPLQVDYERLWRHEIEGLCAVAMRDPSVRVSVEYKPYGARRFALIRSMADALLAARDVDLPNFGVTLDVCHSYMAGEHPPAAAAAAIREGKLFGVHLNDGGGADDDGLMFASVHRHDALELLAVLREGKYGGTIYFDTFPEREDPALELAANVATLQRLLARAANIDRTALDRSRAAQDAMTAHAIASDL
jgi:sugar phosphate isomerase/epimerase